MNYTLRQLQVFLKVVQTESITKAATELHLTQPAVSIQLKNFQDQFEIPITEVIGKKIFITDFGKELATAAKNIFNEVDAINHKILIYKGQLVGKLKISVVSTGKYVMPYFLAPFIKQHPGVTLTLDVTNKTQVLRSLEKNKVDFSLVSVLPETIQVKQEELFENRLYLVANNSFKVTRKVYQSNIFNELPIIFREPGSGTRYVMEKFFSQNHIHVEKTMELTSNEAVKQAVIAGLGYSVMPLIGIKNEINKGDLKIIPVKNFPITSSWRLIWLKQKKLSPVAHAFLSFLQANKSEIIQKNFHWSKS